MPNGEAKVWRQGEAKADYYKESLAEAKEYMEKTRKQRKVLKPSDMPWEDSPQGKIKHLSNERMDIRIKTVDAYMQELPPGGRSGKHRHMAEECIVILEGKGYDMHWDTTVEIQDKYYWHTDKDPKRFDWEEGDVVYIPPNTVHQHFNANSANPARFISAQNRMYKYMGYNDLEQIENAPDYKG